MLKTVHQKLLHHTRPLLAWLKLLWRRIDEDHMTTLAGNLAYVSLLSLVPLIAVVFALFAAFPMFSEVSVQIRHFIFANFIPATGDVIQGYIEQFVANSSRMTAVGAFGLIVTSLLLMYSIDSALNTIWRSTRSRPKVYSFAVYWMILTLGPLLAGASLAISSYLLSLRWASDLDGVIDNLLRLFPLILSWAAFWLLYSIVPTTQVRTRDAVLGALAAALLFALHIPLPAGLVTTISSVGNMIGPLGMLLAGMAIASSPLKKLVLTPRYYLTVFLRLILYPMVTLGLLWLLKAQTWIPDGKAILMTVFLSGITPVCSALNSMVQLYDRDMEESGALYVLTTLLSIVTMPLVIAVFERVM